MPAARADRLILAVACLCAGIAGAAELGTLFHSAEERARLDRLRRGEPVAAGTEQPARGAGEITGYIKRSDGRSTAFVDGTALPVGPRSATLLDPKAVRAYSRRESENLRIERKPAP